MASIVEIIVKTIDESSNANGNIVGSFTELQSALGLANQAYQELRKVQDATVGETLKYADQVRSLSTISGQSAESTSRFLQVLDDYKISAEDAETATRKLTQNGMAPSLDTLAKLSDQYLSLNSAEDKNKFVIDNLGRAGLQWVEVLNKGSEAIKAQGAAIDDGLILSQKEVDAARRMEVAQDSLNDTRQAAAHVLGNELIPMETNFLNGMNVWIKTMEIMNDRHLNLIQRYTEFNSISNEAAASISKEQAAMLASKGTTDNLASSTDKLVDSQKQEEDTAKSLSSVFTSLLGSMSSIQKSNDDYQKTTDEIAKSDQELTDKKTYLNLEWGKTVRAGKDTADAYKEYMSALSDVSKAEQDNADKKAKLEEDTKKATQQRKYDLVEQKLAVDGVSTKEFNYLENLKVKYGLVSQAAADQAIAENQAADELVSGFESTLPPMEQSLQIMQQIAAFNGTMVNFGVNFSSNLPGNSSSVVPHTPTFHPNLTGSSGNPNHVIHSQDAGGAGIAGTPYLIGTGAQPEVFVPQTNGMFYPKGQGMGTTFNFTINNPKPERSDDSTRRSLQLASLTGKFS